MYSISFCNSKRRDDPDGTLSESEAATMCRLAGAPVRATIDELVSKGGWDKLPEGYRVHDFGDYGPKSDSTVGERVARHRANKRAGNAVSNGDVTRYTGVTVTGFPYAHADPDPDPVTRNGDHPTGNSSTQEIDLPAKRAAAAFSQTNGLGGRRLPKGVPENSELRAEWVAQAWDAADTYGAVKPDAYAYRILQRWSEVYGETGNEHPWHVVSVGRTIPAAAAAPTGLTEDSPPFWRQIVSEIAPHLRDAEWLGRCQLGPWDGGDTLVAYVDSVDIATDAMHRAGPLLHKTAAGVLGRDVRIEFQARI